jgi:hypothetical protein
LVYREGLKPRADTPTSNRGVDPIKAKRAISLTPRHSKSEHFSKCAYEGDLNTDPVLIDTIASAGYPASD